MRVFNWIIKTYKSLKDIIDLILKIVALVGIISTVLTARGCKKERDEKNDTFEILTTQAETFKTEAGLNAIESDNWKLKYKAAEQITIDKALKNSSQAKVIVKAKETINNLNIRLKDAENYIKTDFKARDSIKTVIQFVNCDKVKIEPIETKHIKIDFKQENKELKVSYEYFAGISTVISRYPKKINNPKRKRYNKKHFPDWGWLFGWNYKTTSVIDDENATVDNIISIEFDK